GAARSNIYPGAAGTPSLPPRPCRCAGCCTPCPPSAPPWSGARRRGCPRPAGSRSARFSRPSALSPSFGQREIEARAIAGAGLDPDAPAVALDHFLADGEPDAGAGILALVEQPLEHHEDALEVLRLDADAVITNFKSPFLGRFFDADVNARHRVRPELERVADQVLQQLPELHLVAHHRGQRIVRDRGAGLLDAGAQVEQRAAQRHLERHRLELRTLGAYARVGEQVLDQLLHARRAVDDVGHELVRVLVELALVAAPEELGVARHHAQRLLQVVRGDIGELLELGVGALQLLVRGLQRGLGLLALGDVVEHRDLVERHAEHVAHQRDGDVAPHHRAVLAQVALLEARRVDLARADARALGVGDVAVVGVRHFLHVLSEQLLLRIAEDLAQAAVDAREAPLGHVADARGRELEGLAEARLALLQARLGLALRGDVVVHRDLVERLAVGAPLHGHAEFHPHHRAVLAQVALFQPHHVDRARVQRRALLVDDVEVVGVRDLAPGELQHFLLAVAEDLAHPRVDADEAPVDADVRDARARQLEGTPVARLAFLEQQLGDALLGDVGDGRHQAVVVGLVQPAQEGGVDRKPGDARRALDADAQPGLRLAGAHRGAGRPVGFRQRRAVLADAVEQRGEARLADQLAERQADDALGGAVAGDDVERAVVDQHALVRRVHHRAEALLALAQRHLGARARGDVEDHADHALGPALRGVRRLVVDGVALAAVGRDDGGRIALRARVLPQLAVARRVQLGDLGVLRIQVVHLLADEALARQAEQLFPRLVDAEIAAVARLDVHRHWQALEQLERFVWRRGLACRLDWLEFPHPPLILI